jgi:hypothetical protein
VRQYRPDIDLPQGAQEASGVDGVIAAVRQQAARGADWIKLQTDRRSAAPQPDRNVRCRVARVVAQGTAAFRTGANGENRPNSDITREWSAQENAAISLHRLFTLYV